MTSLRDALCGDKRCKDRAKLGIDTRPRVHAVTSHGRDVVHSYEMVAHPFVIGGGNAA